MDYLKISIGIFVLLAVSRFIPHPPNFTNLIALSFYVPALLGINYLPVLLISFVITDLIIGFHNVTFFTWGSIIIIALISKYFLNSLSIRFIGVFTCAIVFFIISNFGVWAVGGYGYTLDGLIKCYILAIPFFSNTLLSTIFYSALIETLYFLFKKKLKFKINFKK